MTHFNLSTDGTVLYNAFYSEDISECVIPNTVVYIENGTSESYPFEEFSSKKFSLSFQIDSSIDTIGSFAFYQCNKLMSINFSNAKKLRIIRRSAFAYCTSLTEVYFPDSLKSFIGYGAFWHCHSLKHAKFSENSQLEDIYSGTFADTNIKQFRIPRNCKAHSGIGEAFGRDPIEDFTIQNGNIEFNVYNHSLFIYDFSALLYHQHFGELALHSQTTRITPLAFSGYEYDLIIPKNITTFNPLSFYMFYGSKLLIYSDYLTIDERDFYFIYNLTEIKFYGKVNSIKSDSFYYCPKLRKILFSSTPTSILIDAFPRSQLQKICFYGEVDGIEHFFPNIFIRKCTIDGKTCIPVKKSHFINNHTYVILILIKTIE